MHFRSIRRLFCLVFLFGFSSFPTHFAQAEESTSMLVAAAADLQFAMPELVKTYEASHPGVKIGVTFGSSGKFYEQIRQGGPFDLFLSADAMFPRKLIEAGLAKKEDLFLYAIGHLVVWAPKASPLDVSGKGIGVLLDSNIKKIAIANPETAPYGRAAKAALEKTGLYERIKDKIVLGENVSQAAQFVQTGAADVGIIGLSLALGAKMKEDGKYVEIPLEAFPKLEQGGLVLAGGKNEVGARAFKAWLLGDEAKTVLQRFGFALPE